MGVGENVKGVAKEKLGDITDNENLRAEAKAHEKKADALEQKQEALEEN